MEEIDIASNLKKLRKDLGLTQQAMAESVGISQSQWANYERGGKTPGLGVLRRIAKKHHKSIDELCGLGNETEKNSVSLADIAKVLIDIKEKYDGIDYQIMPIIYNPVGKGQNELFLEKGELITGVRLEFQKNLDHENEALNSLIDFLFNYEMLGKSKLELIDNWKDRLIESVSEIQVPLKNRSEE